MFACENAATICKDSGKGILETSQLEGGVCRPRAAGDQAQGLHLKKTAYLISSEMAKCV